MYIPQEQEAHSSSCNSDPRDCQWARHKLRGRLLYTTDSEYFQKLKHTLFFFPPLYKHKNPNQTLGEVK